MDIRPLPQENGYGFCTYRPLPELDGVGYRHEVIGRYHNYHFTAKNYQWPCVFVMPQPSIVDGFSPNLNKTLHVGHLRNLALANSLWSIRNADKYVALLGRCLGVKEEAELSLKDWFDFVGYSPELFYDDTVSKAVTIEGEPGEGEFVGCRVWKDATIGKPVVIRRSDGTSTYAYHDLAFAQVGKPDFYITGAEQKEHFANLGFAKKHLPMGLVLDPVTRKKLKSRDGNALSAKEAVDMVIQKLDATPEPRALAWNVLAWNFLHVTRSQDVKFDVEEWTKPESPGLYITYTYARLAAALKQVGTVPPHRDQLEEKDIAIFGTASYMNFWRSKAALSMDPSCLATYAHGMAKVLNSAYHGERIIGGRVGFQAACAEGFTTLGACLKYLGMFPLETV